MSWIDKLIGGKRAAGAAPGATRFLDSEGDEDKPTREASRREMVHVVLRDTMGKHGIPSDWIEGRVLPMASSAGVAGVHVQLVVRKGEERLLAYVHPFQDSFRLELERIDPRAPEWLLGLAWEFVGRSPGGASMPDPAAWVNTNAESGAVPTARRTTTEHDELNRDLEALFAIRDAALKSPDLPQPPDFEQTLPGINSRPR